MVGYWMFLKAELKEFADKLEVGGERMEESCISLKVHR